MILVDTNAVMYGAGADHRNKASSAAFLRRVATEEMEATIDAGTLQEILHRYRSIGRWEQGRRVYDTIRALFPAVVPVTAEITDQARKIMDGDRSLLARHSLHAAVVLSRGFETICSFDGDFDRISRVVRNEPQER